MARQLSLLENRRPWVLSEATRAAGRRGVAEARAALEAARAAADHGTERKVRSSRSARPADPPHGHAA